MAIDYKKETADLLLVLSHDILKWLTLDPEADTIDLLNDLRRVIHSYSPLQEQPVDLVMWVPIEKVSPNNYNPNSVAGKEMSLLYVSVFHDGYTQPVVTVYDKGEDRYVIVDGFHRYFTAFSNPDILERNKGRVPVVVIDGDINDLMASTIRHNRARGAHSVDGMSAMVYSMLKNGWDDADICNEIGMEPEELLRLKHITGFSKLFANMEYTKAWKTKEQILLEKKTGQLGKAK